MQTASVVSFQECGTIGLALQTIMRIIILPSFRFWLSLSCVSLVFSLPRVVSASSTASASDSLTATTPWWSASGCDWTSVDENYDWDQRDTGTADEWKSYLGHWSHYNRTLLAAAPPLVPWTEGLMLKSLRRESEDAFALYSIYQASAMGGLLSGVMKRRRQDKLFEHGHTFHKTPYRVSDLSAFQKLPPHWPTEAASSRVTTVCPNQATLSCPRWLPDDAEQSEELLHGVYRRVEFAELWINVQENKKVGLFVEYDGVTGELKRFFTCRQCALPPRLHKKDPKKAKFNLERIKKKLEETGEWRVIQENAASKILSSGTPIPAFLDKHNWSLAFGRAVQTESADGPAKATIIQDAENANFVRPIPAHEQDLYWTIHCLDGLYFCIPKTFHPTHLDDAVCIELGCVTETELRRVLVAGKRSEGGLHTTVYERWCRRHNTPNHGKKQL